MYSIVMMMALTSGGDVSVAHCHHGHHQSCGCGCYTPPPCSCYTPPSCACYGYSYCPSCYYGGVPYAPQGDMKKMPGGDEKKEPLKPPTGSLAAPARILVSLPADATLTVDGTATSSTSEERVLVSPELPTDRLFHYTLRAEVLRDGKMQTIEARITVRGGEETKVTLSLPTAVAAR